MRLIRESKKVDLVIKSEPWSEKELAEFREIMKTQKARRKKRSNGTKKIKLNQKI